ncbi:MAG: DUF4465 domain-containing protein [Bacteroidales bacterium]|nr:DUF4465 domain-containing protein [Bacteroidales bacterium]
MNRWLKVFMTAGLIAMAMTSCDKDEVKYDFIDFEDLTLDETGYWNGSDGSGGFEVGNAFFPNTFTDWGGGITSWSGFAYSNHTNRTTPGYENQYSSYFGSGVGGSATYAILTEGDTLIFDIPEKVEFLYVTNSTYAALSMREGDMFAKKFGGESGNDPDFFNLKLEPFDEQGQKKGTLTINLADFTNEDNSKDYIANGWTRLPLEDFGFIKKIAFSFESSDVGEYGINTPKYACIDNIRGILQE